MLKIFMRSTKCDSVDSASAKEGGGTSASCQKGVCFELGGTFPDQRRVRFQLGGYVSLQEVGTFCFGGTLLR